MVQLKPVLSQRQFLIRGSSEINSVLRDHPVVRSLKAIVATITLDYYDKYHRTILFSPKIMLTHHVEYIFLFIPFIFHFLLVSFLFDSFGFDSLY